MLYIRLLCGHQKLLTPVSHSNCNFLSWTRYHVAPSALTRQKFAGEKIPTLEEAVKECIKLQLTIYFDVKGHPDEVRPTELTNSATASCAISLLYSVDLIDLYPVNIAPLKAEHNVVTVPQYKKIIIHRLIIGYLGVNCSKTCFHIKLIICIFFDFDLLMWKKITELGWGNSTNTLKLPCLVFLL